MLVTISDKDYYAPKYSFTSFTEHEQVEVAIKIARLYYEENKSKKEITQTLQLRDSRVVNEFLNYGKEQGIVEITIGEDIGVHLNPQRDSSLEEELLKNFKQLDHAIVVNSHSQKLSENIGKNVSHQVLGRALAEELRVILRREDRIGVTGGRSTFACARAMNALNRTNPFVQRNIKITSLAGGISRSPHIPSFEQLSADNVAVTMAAALPDSIPYLLSVPWIALPNTAGQSKYPTERFILEEEWVKDPRNIPDLAIMGIGVIQEGLHPFFYEDKLELTPIKELLLRLKDLMSVVRYNVVGDFGQRFFFINPPEKVEIKPDTLNEIEGLIKEINYHVTAPTLTQLKQIKTVIAISGEENKRHAIWTILKNPDIWVVHTLCTDQNIAHWLIQQRTNNP